MKTNFFRNTAPVIPTGASEAKRSGGISRLTHDATIKAGVHVSRFLDKLGMTVLLMLCIPVVLSAQSVSGLLVEPGTVTFNVSWDKPDVPGGKVWVFVDYNQNGVMQRLLVSDATASAGTAITVSGNDKGAWVINSENVDNFSATVTLSFNPSVAVSGACAYVSGYPPEAEYAAADRISLTGTPMYNIVLKNAGNDTIYRTSGADFNILGGYALVSFTDATGAPGIIKCIPPATYTLNVSASSFCAGSEGVTFALSGTESGRDYQLYRDNSAVVDAVLNGTGTGSAETFTGTFDNAGTYTALSIADELYCAIAMSGSHVVIENPLPANPDVNNATRDCPGTVTLSASSSLDAEIDWYADAAASTWLYTGANYTTSEIRTGTTYYVQARVENTGCLSSARVPALAEVNMVGCYTEPGSTTTFTAFYPDPNAATGSTWTLQDTRPGGKNNMYKVKMMPDGRIWMLQGLKFGSCGTGTSTWRNDNSAANAAAKPTVYADAASTYVGHCKTSNAAGDAYLYNWPGVMNNVNAYYGSSNAAFACDGTSSGTCTNCPATCRGICPEGWHIPTRAEFGAAFAICSSYYKIDALTCMKSDNTWNMNSPEACDTAGAVWSTGGRYCHSSSYYTAKQPYLGSSTRENGIVNGDDSNTYKNTGWTARCVRNY
jgi:uncharacterized protein (TIGR02145 family)